MKEFMTYEMTLSGNRMAGRAEGFGGVALKMLRKGKPLDEILELTELSIERIKEIAAENSIALKVD